MLVDSFPKISFLFFERLEEIVRAVASLIGSGVFTLHCAHASSRDTLPDDTSNAQANDEIEDEELKTGSEDDEFNESEEETTSEESEEEVTTENESDIDEEELPLKNSLISPSFDLVAQSKSPVYSKVLPARGICYVEKWKQMDAFSTICHSLLKEDFLVKCQTSKLFSRQSMSTLHQSLMQVCSITWDVLAILEREPVCTLKIQL